MSVTAIQLSLMRASDADRQRTVDELRRHCAAGRIDVDEYASRIERALAATTLEELDELRADLPMLRVADPIGTSRLSTLPATRPRGADKTAGEAAALKERALALAMVAVAVAVAVAVVVLSLAAEWTWAALLLAGWVIGILQGRLGRSRSRR